MFSKNKNPYGLSSTISESHNTKPDDVKLVKRMLSEEGHYQVPRFGITPYPDTSMINAIKGFQKENGLNVDGVVKPEGPTMIAMARSPRLTCTRCGAKHGGVFSTSLCHQCFLK